LACIAGTLDKRYLGALRHETVGQRRTDARPAAGNEDAGVLQVVEGCVSGHQ
jgi:hypothetical protein